MLKNILNKFGKSKNELRNYAEEVLENGEYSTADENSDIINEETVRVSDDNLKCISKSEYIYNDDMLTLSYLDGLSVEEKDKLILELQQKNIEVRKDNEQFRQKNFAMYMKLKKLAPGEV